MNIRDKVITIEPCKLEQLDEVDALINYTVRRRRGAVFGAAPF